MSYIPALVNYLRYGLSGSNLADDSLRNADIRRVLALNASKAGSNMTFGADMSSLAALQNMDRELEQKTLQNEIMSSIDKPLADSCEKLANNEAKGLAFKVPGSSNLDYKA